MGFVPAELEEALAASGIKIIDRQIFDHPEDRVFELRVAGPARQFDVVAEKLLRREGILGVHFG
jgi:hypothetical protein